MVYFHHLLLFCIHYVASSKCKCLNCDIHNFGRVFCGCAINAAVLLLLISQALVKFLLVDPAMTQRLCHSNTSVTRVSCGVDWQECRTRMQIYIKKNLIYSDTKQKARLSRITKNLTMNMKTNKTWLELWLKMTKDNLNMTNLNTWMMVRIWPWREGTWKLNTVGRWLVMECSWGQNTGDVDELNGRARKPKEN